MHPSDQGTHDHARRGVIFALIAATLFGLSAPFSKLLLRDASPQLFAGLLYLGSGVGLSLLWAGRRVVRKSTNSLTRRDVPWLASAILAGGILAPLCLIAGIALTPASTASLLLNLEAVFTAGPPRVVFWGALPQRPPVRAPLLIAPRGVAAWGGAPPAAP